MTKSKRIGHWRTNAQGTTTWVTEHTLERTIYTLSKDGAHRFVNGQKLLETYCKYCYQKVFFVSLNEKQKYFNNNSEPLISHQCRTKDVKKTINQKPVKSKKYLGKDGISALYRRGEELSKKSKEDFEKRKINLKRRQEYNTKKSIKSTKDQIKTWLYGGASIESVNKLKITSVILYISEVIYPVINEVSLLLKKLKDSEPHLNAYSSQIKKYISFFNNLKAYINVHKDIDINEISPKLLGCTNLLEKILNDFLLIQNENNKRAKLLAYEKKIRKRDLEIEKLKKEAKEIKDNILKKESANLKRIQARNDKLADDAAKVITLKKKRFKSK